MNDPQRFYIWQNGMCITYLLVLKKMENYLSHCGWVLTEEADEANFIIIGGCASFLPYLDYYQDKLMRIRNSRGKKVFYGCIPAVAPEFFKSTKSMFDHVFPITRPELIETIIEPLTVRWSDLAEPTQFRMCDYTSYDPRKKYIAIQEGCSETCAYCMHRISIGPEKSRPRKKIMELVRSCVNDGKDIIIELDGENIGAWGLDLVPKQTFRDLVQEIISLNGNFELRILNLSPKWLLHYSDDLDWLIDAKITEIKIPIQSSSPRLLQLMGRHPGVKEIAPILTELRQKNRGLLLRTEIIIGLPTETQEELEKTLEFSACYFDKVACFSYDFFPNTEIAKMNITLLSPEIVESRLRIAMDYFKNNDSTKGVFDDRGRICAKVLSSS